MFLAELTKNAIMVHYNFFICKVCLIFLQEKSLLPAVMANPEPCSTIIYKDMSFAIFTFKPYLRPLTCSSVEL